MIIYIGYLYYDLMNLYGEIGNIKAIEYSLKKQGIKVVIDRLTIGDDIDFSKYDLIYIGSGTENNLLFVLDDILKYKGDIKKYIDDNKFILSTGNSIELFGKSINNKDALGIFDYNATYLDKRVVGDYIKDYNGYRLIGFQNRGSRINGNNKSLIDPEVGVCYKNFYGTYLLGPILVRNPILNKELITRIIKSKNSKFKFKKFDLKLDEEAHDSYFKTYIDK